MPRIKTKKTFSELSKYIGELPVRISDAVLRDIKRKDLEEFYSSFRRIIKRHTLHHGSY